MRIDEDADFDGERLGSSRAGLRDRGSDSAGHGPERTRTLTAMLLLHQTDRATRCQNRG